MNLCAFWYAWGAELIAAYSGGVGGYNAQYAFDMLVRRAHLGDVTIFLSRFNGGIAHSYQTEISGGFGGAHAVAGAGACRHRGGNVGVKCAITRGSAAGKQESG